MPHECTGCGEVYPNGTEAILKGCPDCGWKRFRYIKDGRLGPEAGEEGGGQDLLSRLERAHEEGERPATLSDEDIESVKVLDEGSYEINVSSLMEKDEIILSIGEAGRYVVHLPSAFKDEAEG